VEPPAELARLLVTLFQELRAGMTKDGKTKVKPPGAVLSTAEAISVLFSSGILAEHFGAGKVTPAELVRVLVGAIAKDGVEDLAVMLGEVRPRLVLVEGPEDATALAAALTDPGTRPPVAILAYRTDGTVGSSLWPFASYSPEYVALAWAREAGAGAAFIDIPA